MRGHRSRLGLLGLLAVAVALGAAPGPSNNLIGETRRSVARYDNPAAAAAAGYQPVSVSGPIEHWLNPNLFGDGHTLDPVRPEGLVFLRTGGRLRLVAALFMLDRSGPVPPAVPGAIWHHHSWCQGPGGIGVPLPGGPCPPGTTRQLGPDMLHVWLAGIPISPFATDMAPRLVCDLAGSPE